MTKGYIVLETGDVFQGEWIGAEREAEGEVVFYTGMTGYQEILTDPSSAGHIVAFSYPVIGNYGIHPLYKKGEGIAAAAVLVSDLCDEPSHYGSIHSLEEELIRNNIPGLKQVDTRALTAVLRKHGSVKGKIVKEKETYAGPWKEIDTVSLIQSYSVSRIAEWGRGKFHLVIVDFGQKNFLLQYLAAKGYRVTVVPFHTSFATIKELNPDGVIIGTGPGNPSDLPFLLPTIKKIAAHYPVLGIGLGHQLIALAYGCKTEKMLLGHRGENYAVKNTETGKVLITSQNHGFTVMKDSIDSETFKVQFFNVNDGTPEGLLHQYLPVQTVQFHIDSEETAQVLDSFLQKVEAVRGIGYVHV